MVHSLNMTAYGLPHEPLVGERIASGVDVVITFSGDKLLGGPQAGIIVGKSEWIEKMRKNPMMRALRVDKLIIAGLSATLQRYLIGGETITEQFPMLNRYTRAVEVLHAVAAELRTQLQECFGEKVNIQVSETFGQIGSGALPVETLPSVALVLEPLDVSAGILASHFRDATVPVIGRIKDDRFWLDLRTIYEKRTDLDNRSCYRGRKDVMTGVSRIRKLRAAANLFLMCCFSVYVFACRQDSQSTTEPPTEIISEVDGATMVLIPARGRFQMGSTIGDSDEQPVHTVSLNAFYMDIYEVTNARYQKFVESTGYPQPPLAHNPRFNAPDTPVVRMSWRDAVAYAAVGEQAVAY